MSYGNDHMINREPQGIWRDQCEAARGMMSRYGLQAAFDYLVGEKSYMLLSLVAKSLLAWQVWAGTMRRF